VVEGGLIPLPPATANALALALDPRSVGHETLLSKLPITPEMVHQALIAAKEGVVPQPPWHAAWPLRSA
jgi:CO/xanthine dehydrogenase Mo-binding subunit